jgi:hypothetical protein
MLNIIQFKVHFAVAMTSKGGEGSVSEAAVSKKGVNLWVLIKNPENTLEVKFR